MFGIGWYRKHFQLPAGAEGRKVFLQFDGLRQAARFFLNGQAVGKYENGVTALGLDITKFVRTGGADNVLAVKVDNSPNYREEATGTPFLWNSKDFNPNFGGLNRDAQLIVTGKIYQTLPLYENLRTTGVYVYPEAIDLKEKTVTVRVEAQVANETDDFAAITLSAVVVDAEGAVRAQLEGNTSDLVAGQTEVFTASGTLAGARFWDVTDPYLYRVYSILAVDGKVVDVCETLTGFRQTQFKGGAGTGGVWLNGRFLWLTGYAQRSANDWPGLGGAYPDWMHDFTLARGHKEDRLRGGHALRPGRGGFNAAKLNTTNNLYLDTECGINRVALRSTLTPGVITVTATRAGLTPAALKIESKPVKIAGGLMSSYPYSF